MIGAGKSGKQMVYLDFVYKYVSGTGVFPVQRHIKKRIPKSRSFDCIYDIDSGGRSYLLIVQ